MNAKPTLALLALCAVACLPDSCYDTTRSDTPEHCANNEGDQYCAATFADKPYCNKGRDQCIEPKDRFGCFAEPPPEECREPCGTLSEDECTQAQGSSSTGDTDTNTSGTGTGTGTDTDVETGTTSGPMGCVDDGECMGESAPFCVGEVCSGCSAFEGAAGDVACAELDAGAPLCVEDACVQCTVESAELCVGVTPICSEANVCEGCSSHGQCASGVCNLDAGNCVDVTLYVDGSVLCPGAGSEASPYCGIEEALGGVGAGGEAVIWVTDHGAPYFEFNTIAADQLIYMRAQPGQSPRLQGDGGPALTIEGTATLQDLRITGGNDLGLLVDGGTAELERCWVVANDGGGIRAQGGATLSLVNCFVGGNATAAAALVSNNSTVDVLYSTLVRNANFGDPVIGCTAPVATTIRNSIIVSQVDSTDTEISCDGVSLTTNAIQSTLTPEAWFADLTAGDFHLTASGTTEFADTALWQAGDPATDIDGDARPKTDGTAGADVP